ncbi:ribosome-associated heat shock protein Hsp15 [Pseudoalteromonas sp. G4]|uniref:ribosome-associated heat shock protein Hsp15 n=1 Tax=Pseudoalteromonas sp. G4 TaxID=2992761 RepID=UPI00237DB58B|nr:ribosome-associated heat shock protein Hsp15 [Pseudoalteromonas sp. G4]MDE3272438.1 ribosome-associated heat shock protein Hsp15 [Pseudoalteromonas sp. G4]
MSKKQNSVDTSNQDSTLSVRLDKWLWAARFYKTRAIAREMILGGKVHYNGQRCKPSKIVELGASVKFSQGFDEKIVTIEKISDKRRGAPVAQTLYKETQESVSKREENAWARKNNAFFSPSPEHRPDKKQRRELIKFKHS